jgi:hypothetical protein
MNVELKVITTTVLTLLVGAGIAVGNAVEANHALLGSLGPTYQALILTLAPAILTALVGYQTKHTHRPELNPQDTGPVPVPPAS